LDISGFSKKLVSITQFNKGQASPLFSRAKNGETLLVIKNNSPIAVVLSLEEYELLRAFPKEYQRMLQSTHMDSSEEMQILIDKLNAYDRSE
jgi:hypothetical protein